MAVVLVTIASIEKKRYFILEHGNMNNEHMQEVTLVSSVLPRAVSP